jgi:DHA3 family macrolide efflux protein-like MFS transporter
MLIGGIVLGLVMGLIARGSLANLANVRLRWVAVLLAGVILRFATEWLLIRRVDAVETFRLPLFLIAFVLILAALWVNRTQPGLRLAFVGVLSNTIAVGLNGGHMPIWLPSLEAAGFMPADVLSPFHSILEAGIDIDFLRHAGPLADILPIPLPIVQNVASMGDVFLTAGLAFFLFATVVRLNDEPEWTEEPVVDGPYVGLAGAYRLPRGIQAAMGHQRVRPGTGLAETAALDRPLVLGAPGTGLASPSAGAAATLRAGDGRAVALAPVPGAASAGTYEDVAPAPPRIEIGARVRRHPDAQLALNSSFSALWTGQLISMFGDRVHQIALAFLVLGLTNSLVAVAFVFVAASLPNLLLSPVAGTLVDRWNQRDVLIVSDLLRAAAVLVIPIAAVTNVLFVYPLVFLITSISIFFRPARVAVLPRIVSRDELLTANSAMWTGETLADVVGYPLAGIFVAFLGPAIALAFWIDAATYAASAILIASMAIPALKRPSKASATRGTAGADEGPTASGVIAEMREGFRFLRGDPVLFANTIQAAFAQLAIGSLLALLPTFVQDVLGPLTNIDPEAGYAFLETAIGAGNLIGGFVIGLIGMRLAKGLAVNAGYVLSGLAIVMFALSGNFAADLGILFAGGIANMIFVIPSQTLFQERTPAELIGRVVSFRFAFVFGSLTLAMAVSGLLGQVIGMVAVLVIGGVVTIAAGLAGLLVPAMRDA